MPEIFKAVYLSDEDSKGKRTLSFVLNDNEEPIRQKTALETKKRPHRQGGGRFFVSSAEVVEHSGVEPLTSTLPVWRSSQLS